MGDFPFTAPAAGFTNPMTTPGDLIDGGTAGAAQRLPVGLSNQGLLVVSGAPSWQNVLANQAATAVAGYTLVNSTGNILTWTAPNDGLLHRVLLFCEMHVTSTLTGGQITVSITFPDGTASSANQLIAAGATTGIAKISNAVWIIEANTTFTLAQGTAASAGAAVLWAELWGS